MPLAISPPITRQTALDSCEIESITDNPGNKTVTARVAISGLDSPVDMILWARAAYDSIGDWTQADADARVLERITVRYGS